MEFQSVYHLLYRGPMAILELRKETDTQSKTVNYIWNFNIYLIGSAPIARLKLC